MPTPYQQAVINFIVHDVYELELVDAITQFLEKFEVTVIKNHERMRKFGVPYIPEKPLMVNIAGATDKLVGHLSAYFDQVNKPKKKPYATDIQKKQKRIITAKKPRRRGKV